MTEKILIIGNGFDLYHHLPTRYSDLMFLHTNGDFQRIQKRTGSFYRNWFNVELDSAGGVVYKRVFIMGHSLGLADFGILREFFTNKNIANATIYYHDQKAYEDLVINLVKAFDKEEIIEKIAMGKIKFEPLEAAFICSVI